MAATSGLQSYARARRHVCWRVCRNVCRRCVDLCVDLCARAWVQTCGQTCEETCAPTGASVDMCAAKKEGMACSHVYTFVFCRLHVTGGIVGGNKRHGAAMSEEGSSHLRRINGRAVDGDAEGMQVDTQEPRQRLPANTHYCSGMANTRCSGTANTRCSGTANTPRQWYGQHSLLQWYGQHSLLWYGQHSLQWYGQHYCSGTTNTP